MIGLESPQRLRMVSSAIDLDLELELELKDRCRDLEELGEAKVEPLQAKEARNSSSQLSSRLKTLVQALIARKKGEYGCLCLCLCKMLSEH